jgi:hypothetical protein
MVDNQRKFKNLAGEEVSVTYRPLIRQQAMEVEYTSLQAVITALGGAADIGALLFAETGGIGASEAVAFAKSGKVIFDALPFPTLWHLGETVLEGAIVQSPGGLEKIDKLPDSDYFTDRIDEFVLAIFWGLTVSFPNLFSRARALLDRARSAAKRPGKTSASSSATLSGASPTPTPSSSPSPVSSE